MKESATIAMEFIKANSSELNLNQFDFDKYNIHIHVPEGATQRWSQCRNYNVNLFIIFIYSKRVKRI